MNELRIDSPRWSDLHFTYIIDIEYLFVQRKLTPFKNFIKKVVLLADDESVNKALINKCMQLMEQTKGHDKKLYESLVKKYEYLKKVGIANND